MLGRPRTVSDDDIVDAAHEVLGLVGPQGLTLAAVAAVVGLRAPTLIQRFGSKRDLLLCISARGVERVPGLFSGARLGQRSALEGLAQALRTLVAGIDSPGVLGHHLAFLAMDLADPELRSLAARHARVLVAEIRSGMDQAIAGGELSGDAEVLARAVYIAYNGSLISWALDGHGGLGDWVVSDFGAALAPYRKGTKRDA